MFKYFSYFTQKTGLTIHVNCLHLLETICMKCQILFSGKNKKKYHQFVITELTKRMVKINFFTKTFLCCENSVEYVFVEKQEICKTTKHNKSQKTLSKTYLELCSIF